MGIFEFRSCDAVIKTESELVQDGEDNRPSPLYNICEIEIREREETGFIIVDSQSP